MFFLIPIGHDELTLRGLPFATIGLMVLCIAVFAATYGTVMDEDALARARTAAAPRASTDGFHLGDDGEVVEESRRPRSEAEAVEGAPVVGTIAQRYGFVPASPGVGIITHVFLNTGIVQLLLSLVFLWTAGVRLEEQWSRPVFIGSFALFGVLSALVYGAAAADPAEPLFGSAGAVAGLMGAMTVSAGRSKAHFAYFVWLGLKPRVGTFEAPAYIMPPLWLVTQVGVQIFGMTFGLSLGGMSYVQWISGFAFGAAVALALRKLRFEERVLKRTPAARVDPEDLPLVAFRRAEANAPPAAAREPKFETVAAVLSGLDRASLRFDLRAGGTLEVAAAEVRAWTAGTTSVSPSPAAPSVVLAFAIAPRSSGAPPKVVLVDAAELKYSRILADTARSPKEAFFRLVSRVDAALPESAFAGDRGRLHEGKLQDLGSPRDLAARFEPLLRAHSQSRSSES